VPRVDTSILTEKGPAGEKKANGARRDRPSHRRDFHAHVPTNLVASDSEWDTSLEDPWLSTTFAGVHGTVVFVRYGLPRKVRAVLDETARELGVKVRGTARTHATNLLARSLRHLKVEAGAWQDRRVLLAMFWTPKDLEYAVGWMHLKAALDTGRVRQRNNLSGHVWCACIKDLFGWSDKKSLAGLAVALGVPMADKDRMDEYKTAMAKGLEERPAEFLRYAVDDARVLLNLYGRFVELFRRIQSDSLSMAETDLWNGTNIPMTSGALVARTFERWLASRAGDDRDALRLCDRLLGFLDPDARNYEKVKAARLAAVRHYRTPEAVAVELPTDLLRAKYLYKGLDGCSVRWWASRPTTETACLNALVQGGRCLNENPYEYKLDRGLDVDITGCYAESLRAMTFPVGLPTVWSYTTNERGPTLGAWLGRHEGELVPGLWTCVVRGRLPFEQDLVYSKLVKARDIRKAVIEDDAGDDGDIPGNFVMLRQEIINGVITADVLQALRAVATNEEWAAVRKLEVVTACAYLRRDRRDDVRAWCRAVLADGEGSLKVRLKAGMALDTRTRAWYGVPLEGFVGRLADERKRCKARARKAARKAERAQWVGQDGLLKLMVNTVYGVLASRHFCIGNTVLANNITARARVGVWMVAKALGLRQCITDGGIYTPEAVCRFTGKRPGLDTLSRSWGWRDSKHGRTTCPLGNLEWSADPPPLEEIDELAMAHVRRFWGPYGLPFPFTLTHKHSFQRAAFWSKADYALLTDEGMVYKLRGKDKNKRTDQKPHPTFTLLENIMQGSDAFPTALTYTKGGILKLGKYRVIQRSQGSEDLKGLRPGDNLPEREYPGRYNNTHFPLRDERDFLRRRNRKVIVRGVPFAWFERYAADGVQAVHRHMATNNLRG
jgi:hypothetical protein